MLGIDEFMLDFTPLLPEPGLHPDPSQEPDLSYFDKEGDRWRFSQALDEFPRRRPHSYLRLPSDCGKRGYLNVKFPLANWIPRGRELITPEYVVLKLLMDELERSGCTDMGPLRLSRGLLAWVGPQPQTDTLTSINTLGMLLLDRFDAFELNDLSTHPLVGPIIITGSQFGSAPTLLTPEQVGELLTALNVAWREAVATVSR
jgi:hypothetical protein